MTSWAGTSLVYLWPYSEHAKSFEVSKNLARLHADGKEMWKNIERIKIMWGQLFMISKAVVDGYVLSAQKKKESTKTNKAYNMICKRIASYKNEKWSMRMLW